MPAVTPRIKIETKWIYSPVIAKFLPNSDVFY